MRRLLLLLFASLLSFPLFAQDSIHVTWTAAISDVSGKAVKIKYKGLISQGWHLYAGINENEGLNGIQIQYNNPSLHPGPIELSTQLVKIKDPVFDNKFIEVAKDSLVFFQTIICDDLPPVMQIQINFDASDDENFVQEEKRISLVLTKNNEFKVLNRVVIDSIDILHPLSDCTTSGAVNDQKGSKGLMYLFWLGFLGGLVALLTPCVFPMIPLTVSFFTQKSGSRQKGIRNALIYGFFIFLIYVILSLPFHFLDSIAPEVLNNISTNVFLNIFFFIIFVVFAFSFFGFYEIALPASLTSKTDSRADTGKILGIFFMALTLALVSFSCTGPILGSLLAGSLTSDGGAMQLTAGMAGFGLALALPFALFALFPNWLHAMPKSGGWLNTVKVVLGFIELGLALKFLSNADMVKHWGLLKREIFIGIWVVISLLVTLYLFGVIKFKHDSPIKKLSITHIIFGIIFALSTIYLIPGVTNTKWANLTLISGFPPPLYYSIYQQESECVLGLNCTHSYEEGLALAKKLHKPILLDFTGYACVNCRRMEENVWSTPKVFELLKKNFIVVSLYVDDKKNLPLMEQFTYITKDGTEKFIRTIGDKWSTFETENFSNNSQPWYAIIDNNERVLTKPVGYTDSETEYLDWLQCGWDTFNKNK